MKTRILVFIVVGMVLLAAAGIGLAQVQNYTLAWWTVPGGGGTASGGGYALLGTAARPEAASALQGGGYALTGGFLPGESASAPGLQHIYLPLVIH